jgi:acyl-CoA dehydrogenase
MDSDTLAQFLDTLRRFVDDRLIPAEAEVAETDAIPADVLSEMRACLA